MERDELLLEKHRWTAEFEPEKDGTKNERVDKKHRPLCREETVRLETTLFDAESLVIRTRAELGYYSASYLSGNSDKIEELAKDFMTRKIQYDTEKIQHEIACGVLNKEKKKYKAQKKLLITELWRLRDQSSGILLYLLFFCAI